MSPPPHLFRSAGWLPSLSTMGELICRHYAYHLVFKLAFCSMASSASDAWSFGVTMWEIFTLGAKPYAQLQNHDIAEHLNKGRRLPRPAGCEKVVYDVMYLCWAEAAEARPSFAILAPQIEV